MKIKSFIIKFVIALLLTVGIYFYRGRHFQQEFGIIYFHDPLFISDAISVIGMFYIIISIFIAFSNRGLFLSFSYSMKKVLSYFKWFKSINVTDTYFDYVQAKATEPKIDSLSFLIIGITYLFVSIIIMMYYGLI